MEFKEKMPLWENEGVEPPKSKRENGWTAGDKPPADWFNWLHNRTYKSLLELRENSSELKELIDDKASIEDLEEAIDKINQNIKDLDIEDEVHHVSGVEESYVVRDFENGITISPVTNKSQFPSINEFGVSLTFINNLNGGYGQMVITSDGDTWTRRTNSLTGWGKWYSVKNEVDNKAGKEELKEVEKLASKNQASISAEDSTGEVTTNHTRQVNASTRSKASSIHSQVNASYESEASGNTSQVNASSTSEATTNNSQVNASERSKATSHNSQVNASHQSEAAAQYSQVNASSDSKASGTRSLISASRDASTNANVSAVIASKDSSINDTDARYVRQVVMLASNEFEFDPANANDNKVVGGYRGDLSWMLDSRNGEVYAREDVYTDTKSLNSLSKSSTIVIANYDSHENSKKAADIVIEKGENAATKINEAIQSLESTGGEVKLMEGNYQLNSGIAISVDNITLSGVGSASIISNHVVSVEAENIVVTNLQVKGSSAHGIQLLENSSSLITNNIISNSSKSGLATFSNAESFISDNKIHNNSNYGISLNGGSGIKVLNNICYNSGAGYADIAVQEGSHIITDNYLGTKDNTSGWGIYIWGDSINSVVANNVLIDDYKKVMFVDNGTNTITELSGNVGV